jgi:predicted metal-dependent peptidase
MDFTPQQKMVKARINLLRKNPFFAHLSFYLRLEETEDPAKTNGTCGVDFRGNLYFHPAYIAGCSDDDAMFLMAHEVGHLALQHLFRKGSREHIAWNIACDFAINGLLLQNGFNLKEGSLVKSDFINLSAEQIYDKLPKEIKKPNSKIKIKIFVKNNYDGEQTDKHIFGEPNDKFTSDKKSDKQDNGSGSIQKAITDKELKDISDTWKKRIVEASIIAKQRGDISSGMERLIDNILETKHNWKHILYKYITKEIPYDYTWSYPSKRSVSLGIYLPSILKENIDLIVSVDTSGSITKEEITEFITEINEIMKRFTSIKITLLICDCKILDVIKMDKNFDLSSIKIKGYGGTNHRPVYEWIKENMPNSKLLINFTDGFTVFPESETIKTIWVITKNGTIKDIPFGEVIKCE